MKTCTKCNIAKPLDAFTKRASSCDGLHIWCKECKNEDERFRRSLDRDKQRAKSKDYYARNKEKKLAYFKKRMSNPEIYAKKLSQQKEWSKNNYGKILDYDRKYKENNKDVLKARAKEYRIKNKEKENARCLEYQKKNPQIFAANAAKRRAMKKNATPPWLTAIQLAQIQEFYDIAIAVSVQTGVEHQVDHIHPINGDGFTGLHVPWNLQVLTMSDNIAKSNELPSSETNLKWSY